MRQNAPDAEIEAVADNMRRDFEPLTGFQKFAETFVELDVVEQFVDFVSRRADQSDLFAQTFTRADGAVFPAFFDFQPARVGEPFKNRVNRVAARNRAVKIEK